MYFYTMQSKRQRQLASDIQRIVSTALQQELREYLEGAFVTVADVSLTQDLEVARVRISVLQEELQLKVIENLRENASRARGIVGAQMKNKVRRIPHIEFFVDESLEKVFEIERLLKESTPYKSEEE